MKVEKVVVRTMKRSKKRQAAVTACLLDSGVPKCLIKMYMGYDARDKDTVSKVKTKLREKGLYFDKIPDINDGHICSSFGYYKILKKISKSNKTTMVMNDDQRLTIPFCEFQELLSQLPCDAKVFQPRWYVHEEDVKCFPGKFPRTPCFVKTIDDDLYKGYSPFLEGFMTLSDDVLVFTPKGASWACKRIDQYSRSYRAHWCICLGKSEGLYTSKNDLTAEIGGQGYWESAHGGH